VKKKSIPRFRTEEEEVRFWDTREIADYWDTLKPVRLTLAPALRKKLLARVNKKPVTIRLSPRVVEVAKILARQRGIGYQTLLNMVIVEGLQARLKNAA
jgi:predicted DNA binding CopG/RHH family protein